MKDDEGARGFEVLTVALSWAYVIVAPCFLAGAHGWRVAAFVLLSCVFAALALPLVGRD